MARRLAFLIGNQSFRPDAGLDPLRGPLNDIAELGKVLADPERGRFEVQSFADRGRNDVLPALEEALNGAERGDLVLLFYAGHGKLDPSGRLCLATAETRATALYSTSIPAAELRNLIGHSRCDSVVLLLDCCYSGAAGKEFARGDTDSQLSLMPKEAQGLHVLTASTGTQSAKELESADGGVIMGRFTRTIVAGLASGAADCDRDGKVSLADLRKHLSREIRGQTPQYWGQDSSDDPVIALARPAVPPDQRRLNRLGAWHAQAHIPHDKFVAIANGLSDPAQAGRADMLRRLLDHPDTTPQSLVAAWDGSGQEPTPLLPPELPPPPPPIPQNPAEAKKPPENLDGWLMGGGVAATILGVLGGSEGFAWLGLLALLVGAAMFLWKNVRRFL